jgi:hypothetical protein
MTVVNFSRENMNVIESCRCGKEMCVSMYFTVREDRSGTEKNTISCSKCRQNVHSSTIHGVITKWNAAQIIDPPNPLVNKLKRIKKIIDE